MAPWQVVLIVAGGWLAAVLAWQLTGARWMTRGPGGEPAGWMLWVVLRAYGRLVHRTVYAGLEHVPPTNRPGGLVIVSNHTCSVDPLLIQAACRFKIRWMMAGDYMIPQLDPLWRWLRLIRVDRYARDIASAREAIRHVKAGGVIGIFPEGALPPRGEVRPFHEGVGLIIARTRAPVLLVWVSGTPDSSDLFGALLVRSRSRVQFIDRLEFEGRRDPAAITAALRQRLSQVSGWPCNDEPLEPVAHNTDPFAA